MRISDWSSDVCSSDLILIQVLSTFALALVVWFVYGYSLSFTEGNSIVGGFSRLLFSGMLDLSTQQFTLAGSIPELSFATFKATFADITCELIVGGFEESVRYSAVLLFTLICLPFAFLPTAH